MSIILHRSMGTKRKYAFGSKVNNPYISYRNIHLQWNEICLNKIILNDPIKFVYDWTNEWFKNNPTSKKH